MHTPFPLADRMRALALGLALTACAAAAQAQSSLEIPHGSAQVLDLVREPADETCTTCGVVVSVRSQPAAAVRGKTGIGLARNPSLAGGPGGELATVPIGPQPVPTLSEAVTVITVRYDNGAYTQVEQRGEMQLRKGERVRVTAGRVEPEPR
jgi:hypothetical protein